MTGISERLIGHFKLMRPVQLLWLDIFVGFAAYAVLVKEVPSFHFLLFILTSLLADAGACTLNDIGDVESDRLSSEGSRSKRPMVVGTVPMRAAKIQALLLFAGGLGLALYLDVYVFLFAFVLVIISHQYSMRPLKMDGRPIISQLFWVGFSVLYYCAVSAYLIRYEGIGNSDIVGGLHFLAAMVLFLAVAETLAKDLRDYENDRDSGKRTTTVFIGPKGSASMSFVISTAGLALWIYPYILVFDVSLVLKIAVLLLAVAWISISGFFCLSIFKEYSKKRSRQLHLGYLLTLTFVLILTYIGGVS